MPLFFFGLLVIGTSRLHAEQWQTQFFIQSLSYNESIAVGGLLDKFQTGSLSSGDTFFTHNRAEISGSYRHDQFEFGIHYIGRYDYLIKYSEDAIQLLYWAANDIPTDQNRDYDILLDTNRVASSGVGGAFAFYPIDGIHMGLKAYWLSTRALLYGSLSGTLEQSSDGLIYQNLRLDYVYDEDIVFDRFVDESPTGHGITLDVDFSWQINSRWQTSIAVKDAYSRLTWKQAPSTIAKQNNTPVIFNEDGTIQTSTPLGGDNNPRNITQRLPKKWFTTVSYQPNHVTYALSHFHIAALNFWQASLQYTVKQHHYRIGYLPTHHAIDISYSNQWFHLQLVTDDTRLREAKLAGIELGFRASF